MVDKKVNGQIQALQKKVEYLDDHMAVQVHLTMGLIRMLTQFLNTQELMAQQWRAQLAEAGLGVEPGDGEGGVSQDEQTLKG